MSAILNHDFNTKPYVKAPAVQENVSQEKCTRENTGPYIKVNMYTRHIIVQELCESRGGRPELSVLTNLLVSVDVKNY